ncbi:MAG TPA: winged helix-turn-helix domain-containing protein [Candidatus Saccharimonadales bacterium]|nr:winged helix-turn-helix domain-containing protein [Candidatus Saccharimonadales bacterium]
MSSPGELKDGFNLFHYGEETLILEKNDDVVLASLEPVHVFSVERGTAFTGTSYAADYLGLTPDEVRDYVDNGVLQARKHPTGVRRVSVESLKELRGQMDLAADTLISNQQESLEKIALADGLDLHMNPAAGSEVITPFDRTDPEELEANTAEERVERVLSEIENLSPQERVVLLGRLATAQTKLEPRESRKRFERVEAEEDIELLEGAVALSRQKNGLLVDGKLVHITKREYEVLEYLAVNKGIIVSEKQIVEAVWGDWYGTPRITAVHISQLRKKLGGYRSLIRNVRGIGYVLDDNHCLEAE